MTATVSPSVYMILHGLQSVNGAASQIADVRSWWSRVFDADRARAAYLQASGNADEGFTPSSLEAVTHFGFRWSALEVVKELRRHAQAADSWRQHHLEEAARLREEAARLRALAAQMAAQAASLRARAAAAADQDSAAAMTAEAARLEAEAALLERQAARLEAEADKHDEWAGLALAWYDAASFAAGEGEDLVGLYDRKFADLNAAVTATGADHAESKAYAA